VSAKRGWPVRVVSLRTAAVPSLTFELNLDDDAADDLFRDVVPALPNRKPPLRLAWWVVHSWIVCVFLVIAVSVGLIAGLVLRGK
jgi:hypothetical protein